MMKSGDDTKLSIQRIERSRRKNWVAWRTGGQERGCNAIAQMQGNSHGDKQQKVFSKGKMCRIPFQQLGTTEEGKDWAGRVVSEGCFQQR